MEVLVVLSTVSAVCAIAAGLCLWRCARAVDACAHSEARLLEQRGRIIGLEGALESLDSKHRKLAGRIYADEHHGNRPRRPLAPINGDATSQVDIEDLDPDLAAELALQTAPAVAPGKRGA